MDHFFILNSAVYFRIIYNIKFKNIEIYKWHLSGTFIVEIIRSNH